MKLKDLNTPFDAAAYINSLPYTRIKFKDMDKYSQMRLADYMVDGAWDDVPDFDVEDPRWLQKVTQAALKIHGNEVIWLWLYESK